MSNANSFSVSTSISEEACLGYFWSFLALVQRKLGHKNPIKAEKAGDGNTLESFVSTICNMRNFRSSSNRIYRALWYEIIWNDETIRIIRYKVKSKSWLNAKNLYTANWRERLDGGPDYGVCGMRVYMSAGRRVSIGVGGSVVQWQSRLSVCLWEMCPGQPITNVFKTFIWIYFYIVANVSAKSEVRVIRIDL
ncbi:unnamed protein product [Cercopithifilaria johnstoni]|uniref:Uncharacterized protein n=1 Tax=Cercopithifilaria johnstoni TaxID=2874296 RepID=A0A8J2M225_9BILA|nr:unnamed protein product [Cercopithifilaria johnstoni]